ncbi:MAG: FCD domain-containing protein, partial [Mesorhizobium sp.]
AQFMLPGRLAKSWQEHDVIVTAIMRGDGAAAGQAAKDHVSIVSEASAVFAAVDPMKPATVSIGVSSYK